MKTNPTYIEIKEAIETATNQIELFEMKEGSAELVQQEIFIESMTKILNITPQYLEEEVTEVVEQPEVKQDEFTLTLEKIKSIIGEEQGLLECPDGKIRFISFNCGGFSYWNTKDGKMFGGVRGAYPHRKLPSWTKGILK